MPASLDFSSDTGLHELHRLSQLYDLPDYVKQADAAELQPHPDDPSSVFADVRNRQFNCGTRAGCFLSHLAFLENAPKMAAAQRKTIEARLTRFAAAHAIAGDVSILKEAHQANNTISLDDVPDNQFAIVKLLNDGSKDREYPLRNHQEVKEASEWFASFRDHLDLPERRIIARKILSRADELGAGLPRDAENTLLKTAGQGTGPARAIAQALRSRVAYVETGEMSDVAKNVLDGFRKMAAAFELGDTPQTHDPSLRSRMVEILTDFDKRFRLKSAYASGRITRPEDAVYPQTTRDISEFEAGVCELPNGSVYQKADFAKLSATQIRNVFGDQFAEDVHGGLGVDPERFAEAAVTLPKTDLQKLAHLLETAGVRPIIQTRPDQTPGVFQSLRGRPSGQPIG